MRERKELVIIEDALNLKRLLNNQRLVYKRKLLQALLRVDEEKDKTRQELADYLRESFAKPQESGVFKAALSE